MTFIASFSHYSLKCQQNLAPGGPTTPGGILGYYKKSLLRKSCCTVGKIPMLLSENLSQYDRWICTEFCSTSFLYYLTFYSFWDERFLKRNQNRCHNSIIINIHWKGNVTLFLAYISPLETFVHHRLHCSALLRASLLLFQVFQGVFKLSNTLFLECLFKKHAPSLSVQFHIHIEQVGLFVINYYRMSRIQLIPSIKSLQAYEFIHVKSKYLQSNGLFWNWMHTIKNIAKTMGAQTLTAPLIYMASLWNTENVLLNFNLEGLFKQSLIIVNQPFKNIAANWLLMKKNFNDFLKSKLIIWSLANGLLIFVVMSAIRLV